jgi:hypothetical protein
VIYCFELEKIIDDNVVVYGKGKRDNRMLLDKNEELNNIFRKKVLFLKIYPTTYSIFRSNVL